MKRRVILYLFVFLHLFYPSLILSQNFHWAKSAGSLGLDEGISITTDNYGNSYSVGHFSGNVDFNPGPGLDTLTAIGKDDCYVLKLDSVGNFIWVKAIPTISDCFFRSVCLDNNGNVLITGDFLGTVDFDPGPSISNLNSSSVTNQIFILKLSTAGNFVWAKCLGGTTSGSQGFGISIVSDANNNVYSTGYFTNTVDFDPGPNSFFCVEYSAILNQNSSYLTDVYVSKLDSNGNFVWAKTMGGSANDKSYCIKLDAIGNVFTTGNNAAGGDYDPGSNVYTLAQSGIFISKLDNSGNFVWCKTFTGTTSEIATSLSIDKLGNIFTTGFFMGVVDFDPGPNTYTISCASLGPWDVFVTKLNSFGNFIWAKSIGGIGNEQSFSSDIDKYGNIYTVGCYSGTVDFDPGIGTYSLTSSGWYETFISKLDSSGHFVWVKTSVPNGTVSSVFGNAIKIDSNGNQYITGSFAGLADFDPYYGIYNLTSVAGQDIYVLKLGNCNIHTTINYASTICLGETATLTASGASSYTWLPSAVISPSLISTPNTTSIYTLNSALSNECVSSSSVIINVDKCTNLNETNLNIDHILIYPNPSVSGIFETNLKSDCHIEVFNLLGELVLKTDLQSGIPIDIHEKQSGVYFLNVFNFNSKQTYKLIKQ